jgi:hypothetical protein
MEASIDEGLTSEWNGDVGQFPFRTRFEQSATAADHGVPFHDGNVVEISAAP